MKIGSRFRWLRDLTIRFATADDGIMTILTLIFFVFLMSMGGLVVDLGRLYVVHTQAQGYADHVALAAAAELDGKADALARAVRAAIGDGQAGPLVTDLQSFADGGANLSVASLVFLQNLGTDPNPADGPRPTPAAGDTVVCTYTGGAFACEGGLSVGQASSIASFVAVNVTPLTQSYILLPMADIIGGLFGAAPTVANATIAPQATAGFKKEFCNYTPLMMCNPYENQTAPHGGPFTPVLGQQVLLKSKGSGGKWESNTWGLLAVSASAGGTDCKNAPKEAGDTNSASQIRCVLGLVDPKTQCSAGTVNIRGGFANSTNKGLNVRFDIFDSPFKNDRTNAAFAPARNVIKGKTFTGTQCQTNKLTNPPPSDPSEKLPRDSCFAAGTCAQTGDGSARFGNGVTDAQLDAYWQVNHGANLPAALTGGTRYDAYRYEIDNGLLFDNGPQGENAEASCAPTNIDDPIRDRRTLYVAVINCLENNITGDKDNVQVIEYAKMFLTEPVGIDTSSVDDIWAEMQGVAVQGADGLLHDFPVLYR
jgi:hypothetical protein